MHRCNKVSSGTVRALAVLGVVFALRSTHGYTLISYDVSSSSNEISYPSCNNTSPLYYIGDGWCDYEHNNAECGYDGGDCCECTCANGPYYSCSYEYFNCLDPTAGDYVIGCKVIPIGPPAVSPCLAETSRHLIVESTNDANLLANSLLCSGGVFEVEWKGHVFVNTTLNVINGTVLDVVGGLEAVADGGGVTQLFAVFGGSLSVSDLQLSDGAGFYGGAISAVDFSNVTLTRVNFSSNTAEGHGGAIRLDESVLELSSSCTFTNNSAIYGGAIFVGDDSTFNPNVGGGGIYQFTDNRAIDGGALYLSGNSEYVEYTHPNDSAASARTFFTNNTAQGSGGSVYIEDYSMWMTPGEITFEGNTAENGGAVFFADITYVYWGGATLFANNRASEDGGAVAGTSTYSGVYLRIYADATFSNNTCGGSGGAMAWSGKPDLNWTYSLAALEFSRNSAAEFGGAIYNAEATVIIQIANARFTENQAKSGGAIFAVGSGTQSLPNFISNCTFTENFAQEDGGAINIIFGLIHIENTVFSGNVASEGGALRLYCTAELSNSSFYTNMAAEGGGSAISGAGGTMEMSGLKFSANHFACSTTEFLDFSEGDGRFAAICLECNAQCQGCTVEDNTSVPICATLFAHTSSDGGATTIDRVAMDPGYWRSHNRSTNVLPCYNADACRGGLTDDPGFCRDGYEGPYCAVCSDGFAETLAFTCIPCSHGNVAVVIVLLVIALLGALTLVWHLIVYIGNEDTTGGGFIVRAGRVLPLQSIKIVIVSWQIITQLSCLLSHKRFFVCTAMNVDEP